MFLSIFELYKIGIGPSSSHTMGPMSAAARFLDDIASGEWPRPQGAKVARLKASLHGSLAFTGVGHASDRAVILGLAGHLPSSIDPAIIEPTLEQIKKQKNISPKGHPTYQFDPATDLVLDKKKPLTGHANGLSFSALDEDGRTLLKRIYYSIGGGFVVSEEELSRIKNQAKPEADPEMPYPFTTAKQMLQMARSSGKSIAEMKWDNELARMSESELKSEIDNIWAAMDGCIERGMRAEGILPGGLKVKRRAAQLVQRLEERRLSNRFNPLEANDWLNVFAMAVNEENAVGSRIVTAPTNGAAGVVPAVLKYMIKFHDDVTPEDIRTFLLTSAAIGGLIKHNASISGAEVGCQGEVGSASAMAAAGLAAIMGGTPEQIENAAEIALEHHLGMTCDPVAGLVQVPCIERNGLGAVKAVTAASLAMMGDGAHVVSLDACVETMRQTGRDMNKKYKETSQGGLAVNVVEC
jgi:L-serine dehydratase